MKRYAIMLLVVLMLSLLVCPVLASEGGGEHGSSILDWLWKFLNFAILVIILVWFLGKPMKEYFRKRTELMEKSISEASEAKTAAEKALKEVEEKLKLKDQEIEKIIEAAKKSGEIDRETLIEEGNKMAEKIKEQARVNIDYELKQAKDELKAEASMLAINLAEKKIKEKLSHDEQLRILEESLKKLEE